MRTSLLNSLAGALLLALPFVLMPNGLGAQQAQACTAELSPQELDAGQSAVQVTANFSEDIGAVSGIQAAEGSGVTLTSPETLRQIQMAREEDETDQPQPIEMAREGNRATLWLNLTEAQSGNHEVTVNGENGSCTGTITVEGGG